MAIRAPDGANNIFPCEFAKTKTSSPYFLEAKSLHCFLLFFSSCCWNNAMNWMDIYIPIKSTIHPHLKRNAKVFSAKNRNIVTAALWQLNKHSDHSFQTRMSNFFCQEQNHCLTFLLHWQPFDNCIAAFVCSTLDHMTWWTKMPTEREVAPHSRLGICHKWQKYHFCEICRIRAWIFTK